MISSTIPIITFSSICLYYLYGKNFIHASLINSCKKVDTAHDIDINEFIRKTWYSQMQQEVEYQSKDSFYCVTATYNIEPERTVPFFKGKVISVYNYANYYHVNGKPKNTKNQTVLCARQPNNKDGSKLLVAPCNLPNLFSGQYWIIGYGPKTPPYEWAVISGGQPHNEYPDGCTTQINKTNNAGLWIFSREPKISKENLHNAFQLLKNKKYSLTQLYDVFQMGCKYDEAFIK